MPKVAKGRSRIALLATIAVLASLFVIPAAPASAATGDVEGPATFSACVGDATADAGFTDTSGSFADASIDCIAYYGITTGKTATTYAPADNVTRGEMALFLVRAAGPAGITVPAATDQGLTDISGQPQAYQDAINQLVDLGISIGIGNNMYGPDQPVARYEMALFLYRFLDLQNDGNLDGDVEDAAWNDASGLADTGSVSVSAFNAIEAVYDLGITTGTTSTTFSPFDAVSREQMAAFIARTLAHTNARPEGISIQAAPASVTAGASVDVFIAVRDANFQPVANALVDVFEAPLADADDAVATDGTCVGSVVSATFGATECAIDVADPDTNVDGNIEVTVVPGASVIWWAWTGANGATFDLDTTEVASAQVTVSAAPTQWLITTSIPDGATALLGGNQVKYGTAVTHTFQLADASGDPVALAGETVTLGTQTVVDGAVTGFSTVTADSDATGKLSFTLAAQSDPSAAADNETEVNFAVITLDGYAANYTDVPNATANVTWNDDASAVEAIAAGADAYFTGSTASATATVYDQYGLGMSGVTVAVTTADQAAVVTDKAPLDSLATVPDRLSNTSGVVGQPLTRPAGEDDGVDEVTFFIDTDLDDVVDAGETSDTQLVYFAKSNPPNATFDGTVGTVDFDLVVVNTGSDQFVVYYDGNNGDATDGEYWVFTWVSTDQFQIAGSPVSQADFEKALTTNDVLVVAKTAGIDLWNIATDNA